MSKTRETPEEIQERRELIEALQQLIKTLKRFHP